MAALAAAFTETRQETVVLAAKLQEAGVGDSQTVAHNDMDGLTARAWLAYLNIHATRESGRL
jgi:hypothetical protein